MKLFHVCKKETCVHVLVNFIDPSCSLCISLKERGLEFSSNVLQDPSLYAKYYGGPVSRDSRL